MQRLKKELADLKSKRSTSSGDDATQYKTALADVVSLTYYRSRYLPTTTAYYHCPLPLPTTTAYYHGYNCQYTCPLVSHHSCSAVNCVQGIVWCMMVPIALYGLPGLSAMTCYRHVVLFHCPPFIATLSLSANLDSVSVGVHAG